MIRGTSKLISRKFITTFAKRSCALYTISAGLAWNEHESLIPLPIPEQYQLCNHSSQMIVKQPSLKKEWFTYLKSLWNHVTYSLQLLGRLLYLLSLLFPMMISSPVLLCGNITLSDTWWKLMKGCISLSGPCSIKFAQWIATRPDLFPADLCYHFQDLQSQSSSMSIHDIEYILEECCGKDWKEKLTLSLDTQHHPIVLGSGCVAHVYKGMITSTKKNVAIKIIRPSAKQSIELDLNILLNSVKLIEYLFPSLKSISLVDSTEEFYSLMQGQLNLINEGKALDTFRYNFHVDNEAGTTYFEKIFLGGIFPSKKKLKITFPKPLWEYSNDRVLVETLEPGHLLRDGIPYLDEEMKRYIANIGVNAILKMLFLDNFIHADMHPGNIIYSSTTGKERLCFIDAGLVAVLKPQDRLNLIELFHAVINNDGQRAGQLMIEKSRNPSIIINPEEFSSQMSELVNEVHQTGLTLNKISISALLQKLLILCYQHQVKLESRYATILVALGIVEGLGRSLDPEMDILKFAVPYVLKAAVTEKLEHLSPLLQLKR